jgi:hypothetical protein
LFTKVTNFSQHALLEAESWSHSSRTMCNWQGRECKPECSIGRSDLLDILRAIVCLYADRLGLRPITDRDLSIFSGVRTVLTLPSRVLLVAEAVVRNF